MVQQHINKEMCTVSVVFPLFCSSPVHLTYHILDETLLPRSCLLFLKTFVLIYTL
jgi:hypothetical protein